MIRRKDNKNRVLEKGEIQRKDGIYMYRYTDLSGKRKCIYNKDLSKLRDEEKRIRRDLEDGIDIKSHDRTLNEQFELYMSLKTNLANSTRNNYTDLYKNNIRENKLGLKNISKIKKSDILSFYTSLQEKGLKCSTIKMFDCILRPCFELAVDDDVIRKNPCKGCVKEFFKDDADYKDALTEEQQKMMVEYVKNSSVYSKHYPMIAFMLETAARCGETIGLTWNDVDFKNNEVIIDHQLLYKKKDGKYQFYADTPKTRSGKRIIPLTETAINALKEQRELQFSRGWRTETEIDGYSNFVFSTKRKNPIMPSAVNDVLLNIVNSFNKNNDNEELPHISAHILRHTGCTRMAEAGMDVKVLQYIMGHNDIAVTMKVYNHISKKRNMKEIEKVENYRKCV